MSAVEIRANGHPVPIHIARVCRSKTPPGAALVDIEMKSPTRVRMAYRHHGVRRVNWLEFDL